MRLENDLKPHNKETYGKLKDILQTNNKTCVIQPTGSGKSHLILKLIEDYSEQERDIIIIEPQKYIFQQLQKKMDKYGLRKDNVKFLTYSALGKLNDEKIQEYNSPMLILIDEMHRVGAPKWGVGLQMMFDAFPDDCKYVGFSATPIRFLDGRRNMAEELFNGCIANEIGLADAILSCILPLPRYIAGLYTYDNEVDAITRKIQNSRNTDEDKAKLLEEVAVMKKNLDKSKGISVIFKKYIDGTKGKYVAFCRNINHLKLMRSCLEQWFSEAGISCNFYEVHCKNPEKDKQFNAFMADDKLSVCLSVAMLSEGVHGINGVILLRDTISPNLYYQQIGRVFAVDMDTVPIIFDLVANYNSIMDCNLKNDLLDALDKKYKNKVNEDSCVDGEQDSDEKCNSDDCNTKEIIRDDIESFFVFDQVIDAVNAFKEIEARIIDDDWSQEDIELLQKYYCEIGTAISEILTKRRTKQAIMSKANLLGLSFLNKWTSEEDTILKDYYPQIGIDVCKMLKNRTKSQIQNRAFYLNIKSTKVWSEEELSILKEKYPQIGIQVKQYISNRSISSIYLKIRELGLKHVIQWTKHEKDILQKYYPIMGYNCKKFLPNRSIAAIQCKSKEMNLKYIDCNNTIGSCPKSKYKYVQWAKNKQKWLVKFRVNGKVKCFGSFTDEDEAGRVALQKVKEYGKTI